MKCEECDKVGPTYQKAIFSIALIIGMIIGAMLMGVILHESEPVDIHLDDENLILAGVIGLPDGYEYSEECYFSEIVEIIYLYPSYLGDGGNQTIYLLEDGALINSDYYSIDYGIGETLLYYPGHVLNPLSMYGE